ncbi:hypothetical protein FRC00_007740 [Tulasnella sp. 408]|nr:hypothetical protein FRC00_007740 [Tulasnella sp. 408]
MNFQTMYVGDSQSYTTGYSCTSAVDMPLTESPATRYPNSYIDDINPVDVQSYMSNDVRATEHVPPNVNHNQYESTVNVNGALRQALDNLARTRSTLEVSDNYHRTLGQANKDLLDQVQAVRVELKAEKQKYTKLQDELALNNHLKRQAETQLEDWGSKYTRVAKELDEEKAINANLGTETNASYERYVSMQEIATESTARNKELEAQLARLYGTPKDRAERAEREKEEMQYKKTLEKQLEYSVAYQKMLEDDNGKLCVYTCSLENQLRGGTIRVKQGDEKPQFKTLFIKEEEDDESHHFLCKAWISRLASDLPTHCA